MLSKACSVQSVVPVFSEGEKKLDGAQLFPIVLMGCGICQAGFGWCREGEGRLFDSEVKKSLESCAGPVSFGV